MVQVLPWQNGCRGCRRDLQKQGCEASGLGHRGCADLGHEGTTEGVVVGRDHRTWALRAPAARGVTRKIPTSALCAGQALARIWEGTTKPVFVYGVVVH